MNKWIIRFFGINRFNFFGWIFAGLLNVVIVLGCIIMAISKAEFDDELGSEFFLLLGILLVLSGQFYLSLQIYHAKLAEKLMREMKEAEKKQKSDNKALDGTD